MADLADVFLNVGNLKNQTAQVDNQRAQAENMRMNMLLDAQSQQATQKNVLLGHIFGILKDEKMSPAQKQNAMIMAAKQNPQEFAFLTQQASQAATQMGSAPSGQPSGMQPTGQQPAGTDVVFSNMFGGPQAQKDWEQQQQLDRIKAVKESGVALENQSEFLPPGITLEKPKPKIELRKVGDLDAFVNLDDQTFKTIPESLSKNELFKTKLDAIKTMKDIADAEGVSEAFRKQAVGEIESMTSQLAQMTETQRAADDEIDKILTPQAQQQPDAFQGIPIDNAPVNAGPTVLQAPQPVAQKTRYEDLVGDTGYKERREVIKQDPKTGEYNVYERFYDNQGNIKSEEFLRKATDKEVRTESTNPGNITTGAATAIQGDIKEYQDNLALLNKIEEQVNTDGAEFLSWPAGLQSWVQKNYERGGAVAKKIPQGLVTGVTGASPEKLQKFTAFRSNIMKVYINYRKWATGVAFGEKEIREIQQASPSERDSVSQLASKIRTTKEIVSGMIKARETLLQQGFAPPPANADRNLKAVKDYSAKLDEYYMTTQPNAEGAQIITGKSGKKYKIVGRDPNGIALVEEL